MKGGSGITTDWYKAHKHATLLGQQKLLKIQKEFLSLLGMTGYSTSSYQPLIEEVGEIKRNKPSGGESQNKRKRITCLPTMTRVSVQLY